MINDLEKCRESIFNAKFNQIKCGEIALAITKLFTENDCNNLEVNYVLSLLKVVKTADFTRDLIENEY